MKTLILATLLLSATAFTANAQAPEYQIHMNFSANNWEAGGATNCPAQYAALGVGQFVIAGGRGAVMRYAAGVVAYGGNNPAAANYAFQLVLLTQCHNQGAQNVLWQAGSQNVIGYLMNMSLL